MKKVNINPDKEHNTYTWHAGFNKEDYYYKNLYPVNQNQYYAIHKYWKENGFETEEDILNIINDFRFKTSFQ